MARQYSTNLTLGSISGASGVSGVVDADGYNSCRILANVTALGAGTTLTITAQDTNDTAVWYTHTAMTGITATGQYSLSLANISRLVRLSWAMASGTTTATVAVSLSLDLSA